MVTFTFEVFNQGSIQASGVEVTDYIPCGFRYVAAANDFNGWTYDSNTGMAKVILPGSIVPLWISFYHYSVTSTTMYRRKHKCLDKYF